MHPVSLVIGINQTNHSTNLPRQCTIRTKKKAQNLERAAGCPSSQRPALVRCPVLGQVRSQAPQLVVPLPSKSSNFLFAQVLSLEPEDFGFPRCPHPVLACISSNVTLNRNTRDKRRVHSWHGLRSELRRYLIAFESHSYARN